MMRAETEDNSVSILQTAKWLSEHADFLLLDRNNSRQQEIFNQWLAQTENSQLKKSFISISKLLFAALGTQSHEIYQKFLQRLVEASTAASLHGVENFLRENPVLANFFAEQDNQSVVEEISHAWRQFCASQQRSNKKRKQFDLEAETAGTHDKTNSATTENEAVNTDSEATDTDNDSGSDNEADTVQRPAKKQKTMPLTFFNNVTTHSERIQQAQNLRKPKIPLRTAACPDLNSLETYNTYKQHH